MKNVFEDSSESEAEVIPPPPKKFRPPIQVSINHEEEERITPVKPLPDAVEVNGSPPIQNSFSSKELESGFTNFKLDLELHEDLDEDFESPRYGLGAKKERLYNQQRSLHESILDERSVGFKIMQRMGFQVGNTIGASGNISAISEPLSIHYKPARGGIGVSSFKPKSAGNISSEQASVYKETIKRKAIERSQKDILIKLQKFCYNASGEDEKVEQGLMCHEQVNVLWRDSVKPKRNKSRRAMLFGESTLSRTQTSQQFDSLSDRTPSYEEVEVKLQVLLKYAQEFFYYCPFCGVKYESAEEMRDICPGDTPESHLI